MEGQRKQYFVYMVRCSDDSLYTGYTVNSVEARVKKHNDGSGGKYTRARRPVRIVYTEECSSRQEAMKREFEVKKLSKKEKEAMISRSSEASSLNREEA